MDRATVYPGALPVAKDILRSEQYAMVGISALAEAILGSAVIVDKLVVTPTSPPSLNVLLTAGTIFQQAALEATDWSNIGADVDHIIVKEGILLDAPTIGVTPPATTGYSQVYIIQVQYQDQDTDIAVLNYYNATNPAAPFYGPPVSGIGSGQAQSTTRKGAVAYQIKAGTAATTGTQLAPSPDPGWTAIYQVTVANGQTTVTSGNIARIPGAPYLVDKLPALPYAAQRQKYNYSLDIGAANAYVAILTPTPLALAAGLRVDLKIANTNTTASVVNVNGYGNRAITKSGGNALTGGELVAGQIVPLQYDGTTFQIVGAGASGGGGGAAALLALYATYYRTPGSYVFTVPLGVTSIWVQCWAGGGGGGGSTPYSGGDGAAGGGYSEGIFAVTPGQTYPVVVGVGGTGGAIGTPGSPGGLSSFGVLLSATGGQEGNGSSYSTHSNYAVGGIGIGGDFQSYGQDGSSYFYINGVGHGSQGGGAFGGSISKISAGGVLPRLASYPGGGGPGATTTANPCAGFNGAKGAVIVRW